jgi:hypothetical protein
MIDGKTDSTAAEAATRWAREEAMANYATQTQRDAVVSAQLKVLDTETGEMTYIDPPAERTGGTEAVAVVPSRPDPTPPVDAETAYRRARLAVVAAIALFLLLLWIRERRK